MAPVKQPAPESGEKATQHEAQLQEEVQDYLKEKEKVRRVLGRVGGNPGKKEKLLNVLFLTVVAAVFIGGLIFPEHHILTLEVAILLVSLKLALILTQNAKMSHFQFWMLSTIEFRVTQLSQDLSKLKKELEKAKNQESLLAERSESTEG